VIARDEGRTIFPSGLIGRKKLSDHDVPPRSQGLFFPASIDGPGAALSTLIVRARSFLILSVVIAASLSGCANLIGADFNHEAADASEGGGGGPSADHPDGGASSSKPEDGGTHSEGGNGQKQPVTDGGGGDGTWASAQAMLAAKKFPGPLTSQGSRGYCTESRFVWRDSDGTLHSWAASSQTKIDYAFKSPQGPAFFPGDSYLSVDHSDYSTLDIYDPSTTNALLSSLPYKYSSAGTGDGVVLGMQTGGGTKVQHWIASSGTTEDVSAILSTLQPPSSFGNNELVIPASVTIPYPLYIVNVVQKTTKSVTFDGSIGMYDTLSTPLGLVVSYARSGPVPNIRLYQGNSDSSRVEIADQLASIPLLYSDSPPNEHKFIAHIAHDGNNLLYASAYGIFAYAMDKGTLNALAIGPKNTTYVPDVMCVIPSARLLMFRIQGDSVGQAWALPLSGLL